MSTPPPEQRGVPKGPLDWYEPRDGPRKPVPPVTDEQVQEYQKQERAI